MALRVGFIGVGGIAQRHLGNAATRKDVQMVGYADIRPERAREAAHSLGLAHAGAAQRTAEAVQQLLAVAI